MSVTFGHARPIASGALWTTTASYSHSAQSQFRGFLSDVSNTIDNATGFREDIDVNDIYADSHVMWGAAHKVRLVSGGDFLFGNGEGRGATFLYTAPLAATSAPNVAEPTALDLDSESRRDVLRRIHARRNGPRPSACTFRPASALNATIESRGEGDVDDTHATGGTVGATVGVWQRGADYVRSVRQLPRHLQACGIRLFAGRERGGPRARNGAQL